MLVKLDIPRETCHDDAARAVSTEARVMGGGTGTASVRLKVHSDGAGVQHVNHLL